MDEVLVGKTACYRRVLAVNGHLVGALVECPLVVSIDFKFVFGQYWHSSLRVDEEREEGEANESFL